jgi:hypothetical protein
VDGCLVLRDVDSFRMHETMREYAAVKLRLAGEAEAVERSRG